MQKAQRVWLQLRSSGFLIRERSWRVSHSQVHVRKSCQWYLRCFESHVSLPWSPSPRSGSIWCRNISRNFPAKVSPSCPEVVKPVLSMRLIHKSGGHVNPNLVKRHVNLLNLVTGKNLLKGPSQPLPCFCLHLGTINGLLRTYVNGRAKDYGWNDPLKISNPPPFWPRCLNLSRL